MPPAPCVKTNQEMIMEYPTVDRIYKEDPQPCPDCPNEHHSLYTIGDDPVGRCFICMVLAWHKLRAEFWASAEKEREEREA